MSIINEIKHSFKIGSILTKLIYLNLGVFIAVVVFGAISSLATGAGYVNWLTYFLSVPSSFQELLFKPWTLFTYMFTHEGLLHILFNVLWLYWMGRIFLEFLNGRRLLTLYLMGGISGAVLYLVLYSILPSLNGSALLMGASASVMAIVFGLASYMPNYKISLIFIGPVPLKVIALASFVLDMLALSQSKNMGGHIAHIGGALYGLYFGLSMSKGKDVTRSIANIGDKITGLFKPKSKLNVNYKNEQKTTKHTTVERKNPVDQKRIDQILDKIHTSGYSSLTTEEKDILFRMSNKRK